jgi:ligand-binding sensor domain-containing protein
MLETNSGKIVTEGLFILLQTALKALESKSSYRETSMLIKKIKPSASIRSISTFNNNIIALGGDDQYLYVLNGATRKEIAPIKINERIRKIVIADANIIYVGTFKGNVYKIDLTAQNSRGRKKKIHENSGLIKELHFNSDSNKLLIVTSTSISVYDGQKSSELARTNSINTSYYNQDYDKLFLATNDGLYALLENELKPISLRKINLNNDKISAISFTENRMFLGTGSGVLYVYNLIEESKTKTTLEYDDKIVLHRSEITKLFYDRSNDNLYSASFDNKVLKFNTTLKDLNKISNSVISLSGHQKWVWDINLIQDQQGNYLVVTADENGNLISWFDKISKLVGKVEQLILKN